MTKKRDSSTKKNHSDKARKPPAKLWAIIDNVSGYVWATSPTRPLAWSKSPAEAQEWATAYCYELIVSRRALRARKVKHKKG